MRRESGEVDRGVLSGVETVLNDADEAVSEALLLLECSLALYVAIEREVGDGRVLRYSFTNVLEVEIGRIECRPGGADIISLGVAEHEGLRGDIEDRRLAEREAIGGWTDAGTTNDGRNVCVTKLLEGGEGLVDVGLGHEDFGIALEGEGRLPW